MTEIPSEAIIVGDDGMPIAHINFDRLTSDATLLMYEMAASAGDNDATDQVGAKWASTNDPDYFGYLCAAALSLMVRNVLAPTLDVADQLGVDLRTGLQRANDHAHRTLEGN